MRRRTDEGHAVRVDLEAGAVALSRATGHWIEDASIPGWLAHVAGRTSVTEARTLGTGIRVRIEGGECTEEPAAPDAYAGYRDQRARLRVRGSVDAPLIVRVSATT